MREIRIVMEGRARAKSFHIVEWPFITLFGQGKLYIDSAKQLYFVVNNCLLAQLFHHNTKTAVRTVINIIFLCQFINITSGKPVLCTDI